MINLFTTYYKDPNPIRKAEYIKCFDKNIENILINKIFILVEEKDELPLRNEKLELIRISRRPTFSDFFSIINRVTSLNDINIIANTDIYFDNTLSLLSKIKSNEVYALNRWDLLNEKKVRLFAKYCTNDTWIFKGKIKIKNVDYYLGQLGCDNKILYDLKNAGFKILNPSLSIRTYHVHESNIRGEYSDPKKNNRVLAPYVYSIPCFIHKSHFFNIVLKNGPIYLTKLFLIRRSIRFQYYYDSKNNLIEHKHELIDSIDYKPWKYYLFFDFKLPFHKLNRFKM